MNGKINGLQTAARNLALTFGNQFNPQIRQAVDWMTRLTEKLNQMTPAQVSMVTRLAAMAAALGPVLLGLGMVTKLLGFLTSPLGLVVLAIGALALAWVTNFGDIQGKTRAFVEWIKPYLKQAWDFVKGDFQNAWDKIKSFFQEIWPKVQVLMERFQAFWDKHHQEIIGILKAAWDVIKGIVQTAWAIISGVINVGLDILNGDWTKAWEDTKATFKGVWDGMVNIVGGAFVALGLAIGVGLAGVGDILWKIFKSWIDMWADWGFKLALAATNAATQMGLGFTNGITDMVTQAVAAVVGLATNVINALRGVLGIHSPSAVMYDIGVNIGQGLANGIASTQSMVQSAWTKIATLPTKMGAVTGGGSGQDANGNVPGQAKAINSGSSTGSGHFLGSSYSEGWQWTNPISGVLDPAFQAITGAMTNAQAKQQSANFAWAADVVAAAKDLQAKFNVQAGLSPLAGDNSPLELGELEALRKQAASGQYSSITVGDKTLTRPGSTPAAGAGQAQGAAPTVAQTVNVYGGINNAGDLQTLTTQIVDKAARALRFGT
jgi:phage-related protein